jgi:Fe2+ transport system protein FeoA
MRPLDQLAPGEEAEVLRIGGPSAFVRRLVALGVAPGVKVRVVRRAPLGDPLELAVNGFHLSIRCAEARDVEVTP